MTYSIVQGNALQLDFLPDSTVDLVVTSPPYFGLRSYTDGGEHYAGQIGAEATPTEFLDALVAATAEMARVLKPTGSIFVNLGDKYASYEGNRGRGVSSLQGSTDRGRPLAPTGSGLAGAGLVRNKSVMGLPWRYAIWVMDDLGLILRQEIVWSKPNGMPESVKDRCRRSHETWFHLTREPRYYADLDAVREPYTSAPFRGQKTHHAKAEGATKNPTLGTWDARDYQHNPLGKLPGSVWSVPTEPLRVPDDLAVRHFAAFPVAWPRRIIQGWCPPEGVVLDPFGGTGTTAAVAHALGRWGISVDLSADYNRVAEWRCTDPKQQAKASEAGKLPSSAPHEPSR